MQRVSGIGGIFIKSAQPELMRAGYQQHLGLDIQPWGGTAVAWHTPGRREPDGAPPCGACSKPRAAASRPTPCPSWSITGWTTWQRCWPNCAHHRGRGACAGPAAGLGGHQGLRRQLRVVGPEAGGAQGTAPTGAVVGQDIRPGLPRSGAAAGRQAPASPQPSARRRRAQGWPAGRRPRCPVGSRPRPARRMSNPAD